MGRLASLLILGLLSLGAALAGGRARAGEAQCWFENGAIVVPAAFGEVSGDFVLDASAPRSQAHDAIAGGHGLEGEAARATLLIAGERVPDAVFAIADLDARSVGFSTTINGVIGADVLERFVVDLRTSPCRITLWRRRPPPMAGARRFPVRRVAGAPAVAATAFDGVHSRRGWFALDTASAGVRLDPAETSFSRPLPAGVDPTLRHAPPARLRGLTLGETVFADLPAGLTEAPAEGLAGAIGLAVWSRYRMRLDLKAGWLELAPP